MEMGRVVVIDIHIDDDTIEFTYFWHIFELNISACKDTNYSLILQTFAGQKKQAGTVG